MNVACPACPAKYAVPDEKVRGKKARITCKRCGSAIIIDGTTLDQPAAAAAAAPAKLRAEPLPPPPGPASAAEPSEEPVDEWLVAITDDRQEPASTRQVVALYAAGAIDAETFLWKEGMAEWQTAFEIPEIAEALEAHGLSHRVIEPGVESMPQSVPSYDDDEATHIGRPAGLAAPAGWTEPGRWGGTPTPGAQSYDDDLTIARESAPLGSAYPFEADDGRDDAQTIAREPSSPPSGPAGGAAPDSARSLPRTTRSSLPGEASPDSRRRYVRPAQRDSATPSAAAVGRPSAAQAARPERARVADLFGSQADAGREDDPTLGRADSSPPDAGGAKLTGARNESSVLFSLDALIKQEAMPESRRSSQPAPNRQREAELLLGGGGPSSIAGLGGDINALVAPDLLAPARAVPDPFPGAYGDPFSAPPSRGARWLKVGLLIVIAGLVGAVIAVFVPKMISPPPTPLVTANVAEKSPAPKPPEPPPEASPTPVDTGAAAASASPTPPSTGVASPKPDAPSPAAPRGGGGESRPAPKPADEPAPESEKTLADAMSEGSAPPFDQGAAKDALVRAASSAPSCKKEGGPTGTGRALVTFATSGRVTNAVITGDFAGTAVGGCVARLFRAARVPKFSGDATTVSKNFTIE